MLDRQATFSGTRPAGEGLAIDADRLLAYASAHVSGLIAPLTIRQFKGGQSNPTYRIDAPDRSFVLRRKPPGPLLPSAHAIDREVRVLAALGRVGFPVPAVHVYCEDQTVIGSPFYLMDHIDGRIVWVPAMPEATPDERAATYAAMGETIARLHRLDPVALGLADFGKGEAYVARQVDRWSRQYRAAETRPIPAMDRLIAWLPANLPPLGPVRIVHGDYRLDNLILAPDAPEIRAVLDWELATLGDPIADFTYHAMAWVMPPTTDGSGTGSLQGLDLAALGIPSLEDYVRAYETATGWSVMPHLDRYFAYNLFRLAAILQGIVGRVRDGTATNAAAAAMATQVEPLAEAGWRFAMAAEQGS
jgi:aminoglycoside phosphotransferase (APT) family kinase protein